MKPILLSILLLMTAISTYSQTENPSQCTLKLSQAPVVRGVKLGMKAEELLPLFTSDRENNIKQSLAAGTGYPNFGYSNLGFGPSDVINREQFAGITSFYLGVFDGRIISVAVNYERFPKGARWNGHDDLIQKFSDAFHLPGPKGWINDPDQSNRKKLMCAGFDVYVEALVQPSITFVNRDWVQTQKDRAAAFDEQKRHEFKP